jgi:hypothetical protein
MVGQTMEQRDRCCARKKERKKERKARLKMILGDRTAVVKTQSPSSADNNV